MDPFSDGNVREMFDALLEKTCREIDSLDSEYVLKSSQAELEDHFIEKVLVTPLTLHVHDQHIESQRTIQVDVTHDFRRAISPGKRAHVPGTELSVAIPYEGERQLWQIRPSTFSLSGYPRINVHDDRIVLRFSFPDDSPDNQQRLKGEIQRAITFLTEMVANQCRDVELHNKTAPDRIRSRLKSKREKAQAATGTVSALGIPMKRRDQPATYTLPTKRRPSPAARPAVPKEPYAPEPTLSEDDYQHILSVLRSMSLVIERNPASFAKLEEEAIRDHFLIQLNGHYEGSATGETFNGVGKTDILIRVGDRNVFIAECKIWRGQKQFSEAIDQLLGYLTWRDCKCALLIFNRNKDSAAVAAKMHEVMCARSEHRRTVSHSADGECRYIFVKEPDPGREIAITTSLFDVPGS